MSVATKALPTNLRISGSPADVERVLDELRKRFGDKVEILSNGDDEELVNVETTGWYRRAKATETPGRNMRLYRENRGFTQAALAKRMGGGTRKQHISNMENGSRPISKEVARKLAVIFSCPIDRFI